MRKKAFILFAAILLDFITVHAQSIRKIEGIVVDENDTPLPYVSLKVGKQMSTITNTEGSFIIKVSDAQLSDSLILSYIGYQNLKIPLLHINTDLKIKLTRNIVNLDEIQIRLVSAESIISHAMKNIQQNYPIKPFEMIAFYREVGKIDSNYLSFAEASLNIFNQGYENTDGKDLVVIHKERSLKKVGNTEVSNPFHTAVRGVPYTVLENDIVKHPGAIFGKDYLSKYNYQLIDDVDVNGEEAYVIKFDQKDDIKKALYKGIVVIIKSSYAIVSVDFSLSAKGKAYAESDVSFFQRPVLNLLGYSIQKSNEEFSERYMKINNKWYPYFFKIETIHHVKAKKKHIDGDLSISAELFISKINEQPKNRYGKDRVMQNNYAFNKLTQNFNDDYWKDFNFIKPTSSLKSIAEKLHANQ